MIEVNGCVKRMPYFYRNSRLLLRIFLVLVLSGALFGWWYADQHWRPALEDVQLPTVTEELDWLNLVAGWLEDGIEIFQSATSNQ